MKNRNFFNLKTCLLFFFLTISNVFMLAQDIRQYRFDIFTIKLPESLKLINEDKSDDMVCKTYNTQDKKFIYSYCIFTIDEDFDQKERLKEEALAMNIDIDEVGYFAITTGTDSPLLSTIAQFDDFALTVGIYPHYDKNKAVFVCLVDASKQGDGNLLTLMSSFRPLK